MPDIVASQLPPGAGRFQDLIWPDPFLSYQAVAAQMRGRNNSATSAPGTQILIGGGAGNNVSIIAGVPCQQSVSAVGAGTQKLFYPGFPVMLRTSRSLISPFVDDTSVYRFIVTMCRNGAAAAAGRDIGFELVRYNGAAASRIAADNAPGIGLRLQSANVVQLLVNGPNGLVVTDLTAAPFNTDLEWHAFDLRFFSATSTTDARWTLRIDGAPIALSDINSSWGAVGTNLPPVPLNGANVGFVPSLISDANAGTGLFAQLVHLIAAPSELMTL